MRDFIEPERGGGVLGWAVRQLAIWLVGGLALYLIVADGGLLAPQQEAAKPAAEPPHAVAEPPAQPNSLVLRAGPDGDVWVEAAIDGVPIRMAFDTGASMVSLTQDDAVRAGIAGSLRYTMAFATANGRSYGAPVTLREVRIGELEIDDVPAVVMQNLSISLLGQSFLNRLDSYQMRDGVLTLTWQ
jgi:aspartyl protease family protein